MDGIRQYCVAVAAVRAWRCSCYRCRRCGGATGFVACRCCRLFCSQLLECWFFVAVIGLMNSLGWWYCCCYCVTIFLVSVAIIAGGLYIYPHLLLPLFLELLILWLWRMLELVVVPACRTCCCPDVMIATCSSSLFEPSFEPLLLLRMLLPLCIVVATIYRDVVIVPVVIFCCGRGCCLL